MLSAALPKHPRLREVVGAISQEEIGNSGIAEVRRADTRIGSLISTIKLTSEPPASGRLIRVLNPHGDTAKPRCGNWAFTLLISHR